MSCSFTGGSCMLDLPTPCGACSADSESYCVHPTTGEKFDPPTPPAPIE